MNKNEILIAGFTIVLFGALYFILESVLVYLCVSAVIALIGSPLVKLFQTIKIKQKPLNKGLSAFLTLISFYSIFTVALVILLPFLNEEAKYLSMVNPNKILLASQEPIAKIEDLIFEYTDQKIAIEAYLKDKIVGIINIANVSNWINSITSFTGNVVLYFFSISFITFFFLKDGKLFFDYLKQIIPPNYRKGAPDILPKVKTKMTRYFIGLCLEVFIIFSLMSIGLYFIDVKYFIIVATVAAIFNVIPYIGPLIGVAFGVTVVSISTCTSSMDCIEVVLPLIGKTLLVFLSVQLLDNIVLQPIIYGKSVNAHPLEIFLVVIISGNMWGILGLILAIPVWSVLKIVLIEIRKNSEILNNIYQNKDLKNT